MSSTGEEGSDWDLSSEVAMVTGVGGSRGSPHAEKEMRCVVAQGSVYFYASALYEFIAFYFSNVLAMMRFVIRAIVYKITTAFVDFNFLFID